jgi:ABC-type transport system substrate-binding protein
MLGGLYLVFVTCGWSTIGVGEQPPAPHGELRIVDEHPLNWISITMNVFEHLIELDKDGTLVPCLATSWEWRDDRALDVTLRQGVTFHNGEVLDAEIVKLNWEENIRQRQPHIVGVYMNFPAGSTLEILTP